jgi:FkbM family methyltransferase
LVGRRLSTDQRSRFYERARGLTSYITVESEGLSFLVPTADASGKKFFIRRTRKEMRTLAVALARLEAAGVAVARTTFIDVGANIGTTTLAALHAGFRSVLACEPEPSNARLLRANVALNGAQDAVTVLQAALSTQAGAARLDLGRGSRAKSRLLAGADDSPRGTPIEVRTVSLDQLVRDGTVDLDSVGFLWLDVEGHEYHVLEGAQAVLGRRVPLVIELNPKLLRRAGTIEMLPHLLVRYYTHLLDLRRPESAFAPVSSIEDLVSHYSPRGFTDLLLFASDV